ncbi:Yip1 family protein [Methanospirillum sp.]|uniref:Yip1 family protein n=1 Tax=Methanospirillum sp. TaxID=45200 RepID=UPI001BD40925|nr:Yip1 family protein [Methanospirillum sp.]
MIIELLSNPRAFFGSICKNEPSLKIPALIILFMAIISSVSGYMMGELSGRIFSGMMEGIATITAVTAAAATFVSVLVIWLVAAAILFGLQKALQGNGSFRRVMEICGYGMVPLVFSTIILLLLSGYYIPQADISPVRSANPEVISKAAATMMQDPALHELSIISLIVTIIFLVWVASNWSIGIETCSGLSTKKALIVAGLPVLIYIVYALASLLLYTGGPA